MPDESDKGPLGKKVDAPDEYSPHVLFPIPRMRGRSLLGLAEHEQLPFEGEDTWTAYELSWLNKTGVPRRGLLELCIPCTTPNLVESKSLKLYLNSLSFKRFSTEAEVLSTIVSDVSPILSGPSPSVRLLDQEYPLLDAAAWECVDEEDIGELPDKALEAPDESQLVVGEPESAPATERLVSHLLRTLCPVTGQPDWGSVLIEYVGTRASIAPAYSSTSARCAARSDSTRTRSSASSSPCSAAASRRHCASPAASSAEAASTSTRSGTRPTRRRVWGGRIRSACTANNLFRSAFSLSFSGRSETKLSHTRAVRNQAVNRAVVDGEQIKQAQCT